MSSTIMCRCCLTTDGSDTMISLKTKSPHGDRKSLEDYVNTLLNYSSFSVDEYPDKICLRCCKALQVSYHFIQMSFKSKFKLDELRNSQQTVFAEHDSKLGNPLMNSNALAMKLNITQTDNVTYEVTMVGDGGGIEREAAYAKGENREEGSLMEDLLGGEYKCRYCPEVSENHRSLIHHTLKEHKCKKFKDGQKNLDLCLIKDLIPFKCKMCTYCTCNHESLLNHYKKTHQLEDVEQRLYQTKELLQLSAEKESKHDSTYMCNHCEYQSHTIGEMDDHLTREHDIQDEKDSFITTWHNCPACYRRFTDETAAKIHYTMTHNMQKLNNNPVYICQKCGKPFDLKSSLLSHERICEMREPVTCNFCQLQFSSILKYEQHIQVQHAVAIKYECEICEKSFKSSAYLSAHRKRHNERHYQCELCPKNYINHAELKVHMQRIHHLQAKEKSGRIENNRRRTLTTAGSRKTIHCDYCEFTSKSKFAMEVHLYKHTGRPYKCQFCPKQYVLKKGIKQHCRRFHSFDITDNELATMFKEKHGYPSRFDAFSERNNNLHIEEIDVTDLQVELQAFNLTLEDIMQDVFDNNKEE